MRPPDATLPCWPHRAALARLTEALERSAITAAAACWLRWRLTGAVRHPDGTKEARNA